MVVKELWTKLNFNQKKVVIALYHKRKNDEYMRNSNLGYMQLPYRTSYCGFQKNATAAGCVQGLRVAELEKMEEQHGFDNIGKRRGCIEKGGIVNLPSRGIPVGSAIAGERGAEGVIPLTDSQQMALLGEAIGRYITVNLTNVNQMNGRILSREIKRVENEDNFLFNR